MLLAREGLSAVTSTGRERQICQGSSTYGNALQARSPALGETVYACPISLWLTSPRAMPEDPFRSTCHWGGSDRRDPVVFSVEPSTLSLAWTARRTLTECLPPLQTEAHLPNALLESFRTLAQEEVGASLGVRDPVWSATIKWT